MICIRWDQGTELLYHKISKRVLLRNSFLTVEGKQSWERRQTYASHSFSRRRRILRVGRPKEAPLIYSRKHPRILLSSKRNTKIFWLKSYTLTRAIMVCNIWRLTCNGLSWWFDRENADKSEGVLFPWQKMEGRQFETRDGWSTRKQHSKCKQPYPFVNSGGHVWTFLHWGQEGRHPDALRLLVHMTGQRSSSLKISHDLWTNCLLMAIRLFVSWRGYADPISSDNDKK